MRGTPEYHPELQRAYGLLLKLYQQGQGSVWTQVIKFLEGMDALNEEAAWLRFESLLKAKFSEPMEALTEEERRKRAADEAWLRRQLDSLFPEVPDFTEEVPGPPGLTASAEGKDRAGEPPVHNEKEHGNGLCQPPRDELPGPMAGVPPAPSRKPLSAALWGLWVALAVNAGIRGLLRLFE